MLVEVAEVPCNMWVDVTEVPCDVVEAEEVFCPEVVMLMWQQVVKNITVFTLTLIQYSYMKLVISNYSLVSNNHNFPILKICCGESEMQEEPDAHL